MAALAQFARATELATTLDARGHYADTYRNHGSLLLKLDRDLDDARAAAERAYTLSLEEAGAPFPSSSVPFSKRVASGW